MYNVVHAADIKANDLGGGVTRRVLAHAPQMMMVEVSFEAGSVGSEHRHPHCQSTYVLSGRFRFTIEGEAVEVSAGDTLCFAPNELHGTLCLEEGTLLDVFTPMREDFLESAKQ